MVVYGKGLRPLAAASTAAVAVAFWLVFFYTRLAATTPGLRTGRTGGGAGWRA